MPKGIPKSGINKGWLNVGRKAPLSQETRYKIGLTKLSKPSWHKGKKRSIETRIKMSRVQKANPTFGMLGKHHSEESKQKIRNSNLGKPPTMSKETHYNWKGGISHNPYPSFFTQSLKLKIRQRDNYTCVLCGKTEKEEIQQINRVLCVNHINFNKDDCREENLNTLCVKCNIKVNYKRVFYSQYFQVDMIYKGFA